MKVALVANTKSGRGRANLLKTPFADALKAAQHDVEPLDLHRDAQELPTRTRGADLIVAIGGDGTVQSVAKLARTNDVPVYHVPTGNENLFAREFGMTREPAMLVDAIDAGRTQHMDVGECNGAQFLLMLSVGLDANVIKRLDAKRSGRATHITYVGPILAELLSPAVPTVSVHADEHPFVSGQTGLLVVANTRQYGGRLDPAGTDVRADDGALDLAFLHHRTSIGLLPWAVRCWRRTQLRHPRCLSTRARDIRISVPSGPITYQIDGEAGHDDSGVLEIRVLEQALEVLVPVQ